MLGIKDAALVWQWLGEIDLFLALLFSVRLLLALQKVCGETDIEDGLLEFKLLLILGGDLERFGDIPIFGGEKLKVFFSTFLAFFLLVFSTTDL